MITATIGKKFLKAYNAKYQTQYSAKEFFIEKYLPVFFDHPKYMMTGGNSPLENPKIQWKSGKYPSQEERKTRIAKIIEKIETSEPDASIAIGFPSLDLNSTTSGQTTNLKLPVDTNDIYCSWIGSGLGVGIQGGLCILFDNEKILLDLYDGWEFYRSFLNNTPQLRGNQINTWNGQWLAHKFDSIKFCEDDPTADLHIFETKDDSIEVKTQSWVIILSRIAFTLHNPQLIGYVYNLGQTNTTIGFIPFKLPKIRKPFELYQKIFGVNNNGERHKQLETLFGTAFGFKRACQKGMIGIEALEPKGLRDIIEKSKWPSNKEDEKSELTYNIYQIWILAMLNNETLWDQAQIIASALERYASGTEKARKTRSNILKTLLESVNKKQFIENLIPIIADTNEESIFEEVAKLINIMPTDNVPYFLTLIRFQYSLKK
ncbi:MAG: hypothetical protein HXX14_09705 [Bacteroidetes bacterium]|nr:hypothetical protein [Bacteroidota bacterium]